MNYYCLIAGFPDLQLDNAKSAPSLENLFEELDSTLSNDDKQLLQLLRMRYENENLLAYLSDKDATLNALGKITAEEWKDLINILDEVDNPRDPRLLPYLVDFYRAITDEKIAAYIYSQEDYLATCYYDYGAQCKNAFVAEWFELNLNINNVLAAVACRNHGFDIKTAIVGSNEIAETIRNSSARDFGLTGTFEHLEAIINIAEEKNLLEREKKLDAFKWAWLEEHTFFNYFTVERVLAFYLRCELLHRWDNLTMEQGQEVFRNLLNELKKDVKL